MHRNRYQQEQTTIPPVDPDPEMTTTQTPAPCYGYGCTQPPFEAVWNPLYQVRNGEMLTDGSIFPLLQIQKEFITEPPQGTTDFTTSAPTTTSEEPPRFEYIVPLYKQRVTTRRTTPRVTTTQPTRITTTQGPRTTRFQYSINVGPIQNLDYGKK